jgi:hypothetical protein
VRAQRVAQALAVTAVAVQGVPAAATRVLYVSAALAQRVAQALAVTAVEVQGVPAAAARALYVAVVRALRVVEPPDAIAVVAQGVPAAAAWALYVAVARALRVAEPPDVPVSAVQVQRVVEPPDAIAVVAQDVPAAATRALYVAAAQGVLPRLTVWRKPRSAGGRRLPWQMSSCRPWRHLCVAFGSWLELHAARVLPHAPGGPRRAESRLDLRYMRRACRWRWYFFPPPSGHCRWYE